MSSHYTTSSPILQWVSVPLEMDQVHVPFSEMEGGIVYMLSRYNMNRSIF